MRFGDADIVEFHIVRCGRCGKYHAEQVGPFRIACATRHAPGDCCHYAEVELSEEDIDEIRRIVKHV
jgi:hypothetical protein